ncbi:dehydrogenase [Paenibacillus oenotherae]|uniref:Dehydrogenase n=1 Tax=Paenibacillus oenotherae TaxID=1435645 RepID=A0ABS7DA17_9BACL|nr:dehydrogenase [Paenibacillus oenotherae]MBW7476780.1 dehydrogenase [Paenibacillus oenotherae]
MKSSSQKHHAAYPNARKIRRACENELYRAIKRLGVWIPKEKVKEAEQLYVRKVILNIQWVTENASNRKKLADWWDENVSEEIAALWEVDQNRLSTAFREAFGG